MEKIEAFVLAEAKVRGRYYRLVFNKKYVQCFYVEERSKGDKKWALYDHRSPMTEKEFIVNRELFYAMAKHPRVKVLNEGT